LKNGAASRAFAFALATSLALAFANGRAQAQTPGPASSAAPAPAPANAPAPPGAPDCTLVSRDEIAAILGYAVGPADESSRAGGVCFFASQSVTDDGAASYAIVGNDRLQQRRAFYAVLARRCAGVQPDAPRSAVCKTFSELAQVKDIDAYFSARTDFPNAEAVKGLGDAAVAAGDALYVKRGDLVFEVVVRRGDALDVDRATALAKLVLDRTPVAPAPEPSPSPRRPKPV
jgi:hypothetical protein